MSAVMSGGRATSRAPASSRCGASVHSPPHWSWSHHRSSDGGRLDSAANGPPPGRAVSAAAAGAVDCFVGGGWWRRRHPATVRWCRSRRTAGGAATPCATEARASARHQRRRQRHPTQKLPASRFARQRPAGASEAETAAGKGGG
ncbi:hypothetical protein BU14_0254s0005 [Porphyra umbilicalis]|uniref:Uncharacterized protein n=1 Tax=Porphyra umbilicalis TaxID=2786 RepID=A0A1X6P2Y7_PORUM|nr:hypothetical protein BU14_0254s0005 [Porphyra umbilicalis]|eukprot:OSX75125.1 hypothetical protein BU14_0254s0005 [Porphyra umbilicalis]